MRARTAIIAIVNLIAIFLPISGVPLEYILFSTRPSSLIDIRQPDYRLSDTTISDHRLSDTPPPDLNRSDSSLPKDDPSYSAKTDPTVIDLLLPRFPPFAVTACAAAEPTENAEGEGR